MNHIKTPVIVISTVLAFASMGCKHPGAIADYSRNCAAARKVLVDAKAVQGDREDAATFLGCGGVCSDAATYSALKKVAFSKDKEANLAAASLARFRSTPALVLDRLLDARPSEGERLILSLCLTHSDDPVTMRSLGILVKDTNPSTRTYCYSLLQEIHTAEALKLLRMGAFDPDTRARNIALKQLKRKAANYGPPFGADPSYVNSEGFPFDPDR